jgi:hypothetical protein
MIHGRAGRPFRSTLATPASASMRLVPCHVSNERYHARWRRTVGLGTKAMEEAESASSRRQGRRRPETLEKADSASSDERDDSGPIMSALAGTANKALTARAGQAGSCPRPCGGRVHQFETDILLGESPRALGRGEFLPSTNSQWETLPHHVASGDRRGDRALARSRH